MTQPVRNLLHWHSNGHKAAHIFVLFLITEGLDNCHVIKQNESEIGSIMSLVSDYVNTVLQTNRI